VSNSRVISSDQDGRARVELHLECHVDDDRADDIKLRVDSDDADEDDDGNEAVMKG
jgi:hypothetical protein